MTSSANQAEIFYVDDMEDEIIITGLQLTRRNLDLDVQYFLDGADALSTRNERVSSGKTLPPPVVTDLNMPGLGGLRFVQAMTVDERFDGITSGVCTGSENPADATAALNSGADFVVVKPFDRVPSVAHLQENRSILAGSRRGWQGSPSAVSGVALVSWTWACGVLPPCQHTLMRHQHRHGHRLQDGAGGAAKDEFSEAGMAIAAHDQHVAAAIGEVGQQRVADIDMLAFDDLHPDLDAMAGQMERDVGARHLTMAGSAASRLETNNLNAFRLFQRRHGVPDRSRRLAAGVPGNRHPFRGRGRRADMGDDDDRSAACQEGVSRILHGAGVLVVGLTDDDGIGIAAMHA